MPTLTTDLRNELRNAIIAARRVAEEGARDALQALAVEKHEPHGSMTPDERALRNRLRARGRQVGDVRDQQRGTQSIDRLVHEVAYEHWHRMLFARFLSENDLLVHPGHGIAVSLDEIEELAQEAGEDPRAMAASFAQDSLPQIFRRGDPALEVALAPEIRQGLDKLLDGLPSEIFRADDSLGWTYQYWQAEKKDAVNESGTKIGADELPAVTQLFTEHYMVLFLYHNTIGAWHAGRVLAANPSLAETAQSEEELRKAVRLRSMGGYDFEYLRFVREPREGDEGDVCTGPWRPAAGTFHGWPDAARELRVVDPCCGSGHFLVEGLALLLRLRMDEEGIDREDALRGVLAENLHGLEVDPRCTQIAAFNLALAAWKVAGSPIELPAMQIACSGLAVGSAKSQWVELGGESESLRNGIERLYDLFEQAPHLGSLVDPRALKGDLLSADYADLEPLLQQALEREIGDTDAAERAVAAQGMARAAGLLASCYTLVITNVPFVARGKQHPIIADLGDLKCPEAKADLATMMMARMLDFAEEGGAVAAVSPQNWYFLTSYSGFRERLLRRHCVNAVVRLGPNAFQGMNWWAATTALTILGRSKAGEDHRLCGLDVSGWKEIPAKTRALRGITREAVVSTTSQSGQLTNVDSRFTGRSPTEESLLMKFGNAYQGIATSDYPRFGRLFWETRPLDAQWSFQQSTVEETRDFGGREHVLLWEHGKGVLSQTRQARVQGLEALGSVGVAVSQMNRLSVSRYTGELFDNNTSALVVRRPEYLPAIWAFCSSPEFHDAVREIDQANKVTNATLVKVPFDLAHWQRVADEEYPDGLPEPRSDDPTQWLFHGHPAGADRSVALQVVVLRLLGYRWPPEFDREMLLAGDAREWVAGCDALNGFSDGDGIVCLSATRGERSAAERLRSLLAAAFGRDWSAAKERELLAGTGGGRNAAATLDGWLRDRFFEEHCKLFHHRPVVWHIWDGNRDGFNCLVNAHRLTGPAGEGRRTLEAITFSYLNDWIGRQKADQQAGKEGADDRLAAAQSLQGQLEKILEGEPPYDLFVRWRPIHDQAIGWEPDINDGVRLNIRPFMRAELRKGGKKGAGLLRWKPNIKWGKDRGKEPQRRKSDFPWFWGCQDLATDFAGGKVFDGNRWNDLHFTKACKQAARDRLASGGSQ